MAGGGLFHVAPPNWSTYCGLEPSEDVLAYDTVSLPDKELDEMVKEGWCPDCIDVLRQEVYK